MGEKKFNLMMNGEMPCRHPSTPIYLLLVQLLFPAGVDDLKYLLNGASEQALHMVYLIQYLNCDPNLVNFMGSQCGRCGGCLHPPKMNGMHMHFFAL